LSLVERKVFEIAYATGGVDLLVEAIRCVCRVNPHRDTGAATSSDRALTDDIAPSSV
jgi:hypothetical protein